MSGINRIKNIAEDESIIGIKTITFANFEFQSLVLFLYRKNEQTQVDKM